MAVHSETGDGTDEQADCDIVLKGTIVAPLSLTHRERVALLAALEEYDTVRQLGAQETGR